ncbi:probable carboxylesterase 6 [Ricinus communis]|uniref:Catalytic, putative n=1 Tax=Ricinus communis TaxID=3988 RepID=B9ST21_RICCO|nr:probable carboxylesterase 6 [Ricinus communis]EEF33253.1 catalytic, putative [Ricinus communis]|eukprot:XP_002529140.1 probable carboxylesterase 6 [Ricinus communis]
MVAISLDSGLSSLQLGKDRHQHGVVTEEITGLIKVYKDGHVERPQIVPCVTSKLAPELGVSSIDTVIDKSTNIWARIYVPTTCHGNSKQQLPLIVYFHGGGFCVGSAAWSCYHEFLARLAAKAGCLIMSVNYRLAPENPLPAAFEDGIKALMWLRQQALLKAASDQYWWSKHCNFSNIIVAGDSAGANIAYNIITMLSSDNYDAAAMKPLTLKGMILIQPFFGGEARTNSEKNLVQPPRSALSLAASDTYWRLGLPSGANRDHPWCNPLSKGSVKLMQKSMINLPTMVCISEMDILKDRNLELVAALSKGNKRVEQVVHKGVGHAFQVLSKSQLSQTRTTEMMSQIKGFISGMICT